MVVGASLADVESRPISNGVTAPHDEPTVFSRRYGERKVTKTANYYITKKATMTFVMAAN